MDLDQLKKQDCYNVPDEYFDELPKMVMNKITKQKKVVVWRRTLVAVSSIAASILLIVGIIKLRPESGVPMVAQTVDSIAQSVEEQQILTAQVDESEVVAADAENVKESSKKDASSVKPAKKVSKSASKKEAELEDADYQVIDMYREEIELNEYLLSFY